jgi:formylglycine-generating enzyme
MKITSRCTAAAVLFAGFALASTAEAGPVSVDTFGSGANTFTVDFVNIGDTGNAADTTGYGDVAYQYRMGTYEISQDVIDMATASGMANVTAGVYTGNQPAADISWYEAAAFVNWLNTSTGKQQAYDLTFSNGSWSMSLWRSLQAWQLGGENLYRNRDAHYFLPNENEWYKAAYYSPEHGGAGSPGFYLYPTASSMVPTIVASGTDAGTAVYGQSSEVGPAGVDLAGGLSPYGTMGQGGNLYEWLETAYDGDNSDGSESRTIRGGCFNHNDHVMSTLYRTNFASYGVTSSDMQGVGWLVGFRVASVPLLSIPEPSTYALLLLGAGAVYAWKRRRRSP